MLKHTSKAWSVDSQRASLTDLSVKTERRSVMMEMEINGFKDTDVGWFCCSANFINTEDLEKFTYSCEKLSGK